MVDIGESAAFIAANAEHLRVNADVAYHNLDLKVPRGHKQIHELWHNFPGHPLVDHPKLLDYIFLLDSLNFSFWPESDAEKWSIMGRSGYSGFVAAVARAESEGLRVWDPSWYLGITMDCIKSIFRTDQGVDVPMLPERLHILHENGRILCDRFDGSICNFLDKGRMENGRMCIPRLLELLTETFPNFNDHATYHGRCVVFHKRAQIFLADCYSASADADLFEGIETLTMFADYRVPQVLQALGVLQYDQSLLEALRDPATRIEYGSGVECEIRGCSIMAVEQWSKATGHLPMALDYALWTWAGEHPYAVSRYPTHRTRTIFY